MEPTAEAEQELLARRFEAERGRLRALAHRMLGSRSEADDAVQETWLRLGRVDARDVENLAGWLTTVVSRICLDMLRSRASRREEPVAQEELAERAEDRRGRDAGAVAEAGGADHPEEEILLADSVGRALLVVLDTLAPAERVAFVLHDMFAVPFDRIAPVLERSPGTTKKLASRARGKLRGRPAVAGPELARQRRVVDAFLAASRAGDLEALLALLAPDVARSADPAALPAGAPTRVRGADRVARETVGFGTRSRYAEPALVDGAVGVVVAPRGRLTLALTVTVADGRITAYDVVADPARLSRLDLAVLDD